MGSRPRRDHIEWLEGRLLLSTVELVRDLSSGGFNESDLVVANNRLFFTVSDDIAGRELWTSDGTATGTRRVRDIRKGPAGSNPRELTVFDDAVFFRADDGKKGSKWGGEVWRSDGSDAGTYPIRVFNNDGSRATDFRVINGSLYFYAPVESGSRFLDEHIRLDAGSSAPVRTDVRQMPHATGLGSRVYFGSYLRFYDPATNTTHDIDGDVRYFSAPTQIDAKLFFVRSSITERELWVTDGTRKGTKELKDIRPGSRSSDPSELIAHNGVLYFSANDGVNGIELWRSDGTTEGTFLLKDIHRGAGDSAPSEFCSIGNTLYFTASDGAGGFELWRTDGTAAGTVLLKEIRSGPIGSAPHNLADINGTLYFAADDGTGGVEVWKSNGTSAGTLRVADVRPGPLGSYPSKFVELGGHVYFAVVSAVHGYELWRSDGSNAGTRRVIEFPTQHINSSAPKNLLDFNGNLRLSAFNGSESLRWQSFGAATRTHPVADLLAPQAIVNGVAFHSSSDGLWRSDGTDAGSYRIFDDLFLGFAAAAGSNVVFGLAGQLWSSDGSAVGTRQIRSTNGSSLAFLGGGASADGVALFTTYSYAQLWRTDGTEAGTWVVKSFNFQLNNTGQRDSVRVGSLVFFMAGHEIWRTDGTTAGTYKLMELPAFTATLAPKLYAAGGICYLVYAADGRQTLARSDGTVAGTTVIKDVGPIEPGIEFTSVATVGSKVVFAATNGAHGFELWRTDGTATGTVMLKDIYRGGRSSMPKNFMSHANRAYFSAYDAATGREIYETDGTSAGTKLVSDIHPGENGSDPRSFTVASDTLYFTATDPTYGTELWKVVRPAILSGIVFNDRDHDRTYNSGDGRLVNVRVFADGNRNRRFDAGEIFTMSDSTGSYRLELPPGTHQIVVATIDGWVSTSANPFTLTVAPEQNVRRYFGQAIGGRIAGSIFRDNNRNRVQDVDEAGLPGWLIYVDEDNDGVFDSTERSVLADLSGNWSFDGLLAGVHRVRAVQPSGWRLTTPSGGAFVLTLSPGQSSTGHIFGQKRLV